MLSINEAQIVQKAVNCEIFNGENIFCIEDATCMTRIPYPPDSDGYTIWAVQIDDITILAWLDYTDDGVHVRKVRKLAW